MKGRYLLILILIGIAFVLLIIPSTYAETGHLTVDASTTNTYIDETSTSANGATFLWTKMFFDSSDYNHITDILITFESDWVFAHDAASTDFTITAGGTGSGTVTYNKNSKTAYFFFNNAAITSSPVTISYVSPILNDITGIAGTVQKNPGAPGVGDPVYFAGTDGTMSSCNIIVGKGCSIQVTTSKIFSNNYNVTYNNGLANVSIDKSISSINSKIEIRNQTAQKFIETTFNTVSFSYAFVYDNELILNMSDSAGNYDLVLVNSSGGVGLPTPTPTPPPIAPGESSAISFDRTSYTVNDVGIITTNYAFGFFDFISTYRVDFYSNNIPLISQFTLDQSLSTQSFQVSFPQTGIYTANIVKSTPLFGDSIQATATVQANIGTSYIFSPTTVPVGRAFQVGYVYGLNTTNTIGTGLYVYRIDSQTGNEILERVFINSTTPIIAGTQYNVGVYVDQQSDYILKLREANITNPLTTQIITSTFGIVAPPTTNITTSFINTDKTNYFYSDYMTINYGVDNTNWTCCGYVFRIDGFSNVLNLPTFTRSVGSQTSILNFVVDGTTVNEYYVTGAYDMRLIAKNDTSEIIITNTSITILNSTTDGYVISPSPREGCPGTQINIKVVTPSISQFHIALNGQSINGYPRVINGTKNINQAFNTAGTYQLYLFDNITSEMKFSSSFTIKPCTTPSPPTTQAASQTAGDLSGLLQNKVFWGLIFIIGIMLLIAVYERKGK